ncbi:MAG: sulfotransferase family 2 domain-containing protein [Vicinamibacteria bacterium]|nr:sulfotransferase family 2 domain-containing protein [Vicinamibacteria bacterium]
MPPIFFLHVPKTGGTSVVTSLRAALGEDAVVVVPERDANGAFLSMKEKCAWAAGRRSMLRKAGFICGHYLYGLHEHLEVAPRYVTVFREPLQRMVSQFRHIRTTRSRALPQHEEVQGMDFERFNRRAWARDATGYHCAPNVFTYMLSGGDATEFGGNRAAKHLARDFVTVGVLSRLQDFMARLSIEADAPLAVERRRVNEEVPEIDVTLQAMSEFHEQNRLDLGLYALASIVSRISL